MMKYENFKDVVIEKFKDYLSEEYKDMQLRVERVCKVNRILDGISLVGKSAGANMFPTIYIDHMYEEYLACNDLQEVMKKWAACVEQVMKDMDKIGTIDFADAKDNIVFQLVNTQQNREMLAGVPHREYLDLSIAYRWIVNIDSDGIQNILITNKMAKQMGLTEEQMFNLAMKNTRRILPPTVKSMNDMIRDRMPSEIADMMIGEMSDAPDESMMWIISNEMGINGAVSMLYEDQLQALAAKLDEDLYILPSSIHEVIAVSADKGDLNELAAMVAEANLNEVELDEILSNQVYHYDKELRRLTLATDTTNKKAD